MDAWTRLYVWFDDESNRTLLMFALAFGLGLASVVMFFLGDDGSPSRLQLVLVIASMVVIFAMMLRSAAFDA